MDPSEDSFYNPALYRHMHLLDLPALLPEDRPDPDHYEVKTTPGGVSVEAGGYLCHLPRPATVREAMVMGMMVGHALGFRRAVQTGTKLLRDVFAEEQAERLTARWEEALLSDAEREVLDALFTNGVSGTCLEPDPFLHPDLVEPDRPG
ncbi:MAG: hypothetical protein WBF53_08150 [Litorimonas sp.]